MASREGIYHSKKKKDVPPQYFVKETRYHPNGFTVYKVICRVAVPASFECFKESFVWKRYSDFRDLYKCLATLHRKLFLDGQIPDFAKPKLFGRFDEVVIEERRKSAESVLNFATEHPALFRSDVFKEFFQALRPVESTSEIRYLKQAPLKPNIQKERRSVESEQDLKQSDESQSGISTDDLQFFDPFSSTKEFIDSTSANQDETWISQIKRTFSTPQDEVVGTEKNYQQTELESEDESELLEALQVSAGQVDLQDYHKRNKGQGENSGLEREGKVVSNESKLAVNMDLEKLYDDSNAREQHRKSSKAGAYLEAVIKQNEFDSKNSAMDVSVDGLSSKYQSGLGVRNGVNGNPSSTGLATRSSLLDLPKMLMDDSGDDENRGAYVVQAAQQISFARAAEIKLSYEEAFGHYKAAINTLLQGVQGDTNEERIQAVRRKTANYLKRAEDIHSLHLKSAIDSQDLWKPDSKSSSPRPGIVYPPNVQRTRKDTSSPVPNIPSPRHNSKDLSFYKVLGTVGKVLLVLDTRTNETYAMKILMKSCQNRLRKGVIPTNVPYMVRLHRYYSTEQAVCLVMEHASGGKLWDQLEPYFNLCKSKRNHNSAQPKKIFDNATSPEGGFCSTPLKGPNHINVDPSEEFNNTPSYLDVCLEYQSERDRAAEEEAKLSDLRTAQDPDTKNRKDHSDDSPDSGSTKRLPVQRTWSYLSWDDPATVMDTVNADQEVNTEAKTDVFVTDFKEISSQGNLKLFTIDPDDEDDTEVIENIQDSRSNDDVSEEEHDGLNVYARELLSEQDMSAVSLIGENDDKTTDQELELRSATLSLSRILNESKSSPCLSMNSSFEDERKRSEEDCSSVTTVVDENGVSSVDAKTLFRTHSRTRSTTSTSENRNLDKPDLVKDIVTEESEDEEGTNLEDGNSIHSVFVGMDNARKRSMSYRIPEYTVQRWAAEIIIAVGTLHSIAILCRDLNPENILISADGHIRLSYFGKWRQVERKPCDKIATKNLYVAPEMSQIHEKKTEACDWWSVGAILYELLTGMPLHVAHPAGIYSHTVLTLPDHLSQEAKSLLTELLQYYPTQRLGYGLKGLDDLMDHPFFDDTEWDFVIEDCNSS